MKGRERIKNEFLPYKVSGGITARYIYIYTR